ncbi:FAD-dependent monooxygenase [Streptomyces sp. NBC_01387]|uniref:FAD-dependent monooxygenase n=1 Tax=unclassified Streptomyces TaxID=2593676 RepID=UPI0020245018|nr:FAD-dependent monooxygenase [Streptomyces sp. A 4/2]WSV55740.1 FAD-dependent monooxygenase [Streptomyces sp. NBC_01014]
MNADVVVAGAGPVGLLTAALLDAAGLSVQVFERNAGPSAHSKAITMHPRTLEALSTLEAGGQRLSEVLVEQGRPTPRAHFAVLPEMLDYSALDTPYPFVLMIPQARTERILADLLRERAVPVHYGQAVTGFEQDASAVRVRVGDAAYEARYLVAADGGHSLLRGLAGIDFPGSPPTTAGFTADVELADPPAAPQHRWHRDTGSLSIVPLPDGQYRIFGTEAVDTGLAPDEVRKVRAEPLTLPELRAKVRRITGTDCGIRDVFWSSWATDSTRHADRYRSGRVLLAGDAAHIHLPAGGQGMNVGMQDAANLCWKLAAEHHGWAPAHLVDGPFDYTHERQPIAARLAANTLAQGVLMNTFTPGVEALRTLFSDLIARGGDTARELAGWLSGLDLAYPAPAGAHPLTGTRAPDLTLTGGTLLHALRQDRFVLADFTPEQRFAGLGSPRVDVRSARPRPGAWSELEAALIRPDGYTAVATGSASPDELSAVVAEWTTPGQAC